MTRKKVRIRFVHGLGDSIQFSVVLKHLAKYKPDWDIDVITGVGKASALRGLCHDSMEHAVPKTYDYTFEPGWWENYERYHDRPNTKITKCLSEVFGIPYDPALARYAVYRNEGDLEICRRALEDVGCVVGENGKYNAVLLHYEGNTSPGKKNFSHDFARRICETAIDCGRVPIVLDWDQRSNIHDGKRIMHLHVGHAIWNATGTGNSSRLAGLCDLSDAFIGIDSGPGKVASASDTPNLSCWHGHHPLQFHDPSPSTTHLVPADHERLPPVNGDEKLKRLAEKLFTFRYYQRTPEVVACDWLQSTLGMGSRIASVSGFQVPPHDPEQAWVIIQDVYINDSYKTALRPRAEGVEYVVDIGANIGAFSRLWASRNPDAKIVGVEMIDQLCDLYELNVPAAKIIRAACSYATGELAVLNAMHPHSKSIGGSRLVSADDARRTADPQYVKTEAPRVVTLEQVLAEAEFPHADILKLDCEGSEFSILDECDLSKVGTIFVESHDAQRWRDLLRRRFKGWDIGHMFQAGEFGIWHLVSPNPPRKLD